MNKRKTIISITLIFLGVMLILYLIANSYGVQMLKGQWLAGLDPKRWEHVKDELQNKTDNELYKLLFHGDHIIRGVALQKLSGRKKIEWFDKYKSMLKHHRFEIRSAGRGLMFSASSEPNVCNALMKDMERYEPTDKDYLQNILMLVKRKYQPVYPYIVAYAKEGGWRSAAATYFEDLGDPKALDVLYDLKKQVPQADKFSIVDELAFERLNKAIATLEAIKAKQQNNFE